MDYEKNILVNQTLFRRAFAEAVAKAINDNPECIRPGHGDADKVIGSFIAFAENRKGAFLTLEQLRMFLKLIIGERSAAYRSIPDLFTKG